MRTKGLMIKNRIDNSYLYISILFNRIFALVNAPEN